MPVAVPGATGVAAYYGRQNPGLVSTSAGTAAVLQAVLPIATALIAVVWLREWLSPVLLRPRTRPRPCRSGRGDV